MCIMLGVILFFIRHRRYKEENTKTKGIKEIKVLNKRPFDYAQGDK